MKVTIREKLYDFISDYPAGWQNSTGDFFKCPVVIGDIKCFIKRFEVKSPREIPGWELLLRLKHKNEANLPRIYDIININEKGRPVYYIFYEYLKGSSLDNKIADGSPVDVERLVIDLFNAFESISKYDFWFTDFNEKNVFIEDGGRVLLVDLDSAQPSAKLPTKAMYNNKPYWSFVYKFYTEMLTLAESGILNVPGIAVNYLQVIFFVLRHKLADGQPSEYSSPKLVADLPASLAAIDPAFDELFNKIYDDGSYARPSYTAAQIKELIFQKIIYNKIESAASKVTPEIVSFKSSAPIVSRGESFTLSWEVKHASAVEIYKNGISFKKLNADVSNISMNEFYDGKDKDIVYSLIASSSYGQSKPLPVIVKITDRSRASKVEPEIISFAASTNSIHKGETFTLDWEVSNATHTELYKNGSVLKKFSTDNTSFATSEFYDGKDKDIEYSLVAFNADGQSNPKLVTVRISEKPTKKTKPKETVEIEETAVISDPPVTTDPDPTLANEAPVITFFRASTLSVSEGEKFSLEWEVSNATYLEIYKNGARFKRPDPTTSNLTTTAFYDEKDESLVYVLLARNAVSEVKSEPVLVDLKPLDVKPIGWLNPKVLRGYLFAALLLVVLIVAAFIFYKNVPGKSVIMSVNPDTVTEEHTVVVAGKNLPTDTANMQVLFNTIPGTIVFSSKDNMRVTVPILAEKLGDGNVEVALIFKGDTIYAPKKLLVTRDLLQTDSVPIVEVPPTVIDSPLVEVAKKPRVPVKDTVKKIEIVTEPIVVEKHEEPKTDTDRAISISDFVNVTSNDFKKGIFGGLKNLTVTVKNDSKYDLENVKVSVSYKTRSERAIRDKTIDFPNIKAHSSGSIDMPDTRRGRKVSFSIVEISSRQFNEDIKGKN